jgi:hypothetical protein
VNELAQELTKLQELVTAIHDAESRVESHELTDYDLRARGSILHDLYHGMESICLRIFNWKQMQPLWHDAINMLNVFTAHIEKFIAALRMKANDL